MLEDIAALDLDLLGRFQAAGAFGQWRVSQLFVGTKATVGELHGIKADLTPDMCCSGGAR